MGAMSRLSVLPVSMQPWMHSVLCMLGRLSTRSVLFVATSLAALILHPNLWFQSIIRCRDYPRFKDGRPVAPYLQPSFPFGNMATMLTSPIIDQVRWSLQGAAKAIGYTVEFLLSQPVVMVVDNDAGLKEYFGAKITMQAERTLGKMLPLWDRLFGKGLFMVGPSDWKRQHRICMRGFGPKQLFGFASIIESVVAAEFEGLSAVTNTCAVTDACLSSHASKVDKDLATQRPQMVKTRSISGQSRLRSKESFGITSTASDGTHEWDPVVFLKTLAARVVISVLFGKGISVDDEKTLVEGIDLITLAAQSNPMYLFSWYVDLPFSEQRGVRKALKDLHRVAQKFVARERSHNKAAEDEHSHLLSLLVHARDDEGSQLSEDELVHNVYSFLGAGIATTSDSLTTTLFMLARHPEVQSNLHQELATGPLEWDFLKKLPYLSAVITESLRLFPPVSATVARELTKDAELPGGLHVSKGQAICANILTSQRRPGIWGPDADDFRPERFLEGQGEDKGVGNPMAPHKLPSGIADTSFLAFSYGVRPCIGRPLAMTEMKMAIAHAVRHFSIMEMQPQSFEMVKGVPQVSVKRGLKLGLRAREQQVYAAKASAVA